MLLIYRFLFLASGHCLAKLNLFLSCCSNKATNLLFMKLYSRYKVFEHTPVLFFRYTLCRNPWTVYSSTTQSLSAWLLQYYRDAIPPAADWQSMTVPWNQFWLWLIRAITLLHLHTVFWKWGRTVAVLIWTRLKSLNLSTLWINHCNCLTQISMTGCSLKLYFVMFVWSRLLKVLRAHLYPLSRACHIFRDAVYIIHLKMRKSPGGDNFDLQILHLRASVITASHF